MSMNSLNSIFPDLSSSSSPSIGTCIVIGVIWCLIASCSCIIFYAFLNWIAVCFCGGSINQMVSRRLRRRREIIVTPLTAQQKALIGEFVHHETTEEGSIHSEDSSCTHSSSSDCLFVCPASLREKSVEVCPLPADTCSTRAASTSGSRPARDVRSVTDRFI